MINPLIYLQNICVSFKDVCFRFSAAQWLKPKEAAKRKSVSCSNCCSKTYLTNSRRKIIFYILYLLINFGLGGYAAYYYSESNGFIIVARVCGLPLNFNCMLLVLLILRKSITYLRMTFMYKVLPLDHNILFHKQVGLVIGLLSAVHTVAHVGNGCKFILSNIVFIFLS